MAHVPEPQICAQFIWFHVINVANGHEPNVLCLWSNSRVTFGDSLMHGGWQFNEEDDSMDVSFHHAARHPKLHHCVRLGGTDSFIHWGATLNDIAIISPIREVD